MCGTDLSINDKNDNILTNGSCTGLLINNFDLCDINSCPKECGAGFGFQ